MRLAPVDRDMEYRNRWKKWLSASSSETLPSCPYLRPSQAHQPGGEPHVSWVKPSHGETVPLNAIWRREWTRSGGREETGCGSHRLARSRSHETLPQTAWRPPAVQFTSMSNLATGGYKSQKETVRPRSACSYSMSIDLLRKLKQHGPPNINRKQMKRNSLFFFCGRIQTVRPPKQMHEPCPITCMYLCLHDLRLCLDASRVHALTCSSARFRPVRQENLQSQCCTPSKHRVT